MIRAFAFALSLFGACPVWAFEPDFGAAARETLGQDRGVLQYALPSGPFQNGQTPTAPVTGQVDLSIWRLEAGATTQQVIDMLAGQVTAAGYAPIFTCLNASCGGFDFRFSIDVAPAPSMYVNLGDFGFGSAMNEAGGALSFLVSSTQSETFVQIVQITPDPAPQLSDLGAALAANGHVVLSVTDDAGSSNAPDRALAGLALFLAEHGQARIAIVAHGGGAEDDDASRARGLAQAQSVQARLVSEFSVDPARVEALWLGPFAPRTSPNTPEGRRLNARIEAVLLPGPLTVAPDDDAAAPLE